MKRAAFIQKTQHVLLKRRDALRRSIHSELALLGRNWTLRPVGDSGDDAQDGADDEMVSRLAQTESRELQAIETALARMREGQYGLCEACDSPIPMARLNALPYATMCIKCQREAENDGHSGRADVDWGRILDTNSLDADLSINDIELDVS